MADRWLTYQELGEVLGCSAVAARARAQRARWRRQTSNSDGLARVLLPDDAELRPVRTRNTRPSAPGAHPRTPNATEGELLTRLAALQTELADMARKLGAAEERVEGLRTVLDVERRQASELRQDRDRALEQLEQAQAAHVDELLALREQMAAIAHDRDRAAEALAAHLALPWWRRLFA